MERRSRSERRWTSGADALDRVTEIVAAPLPQLLQRTSRALRVLVPHTAAAQLSEVSAYAPRQAAGTDSALASRITSAELGQLAVRVPVGTPWQGEAVLAGAPRAVLGIASSPPGKGGALLALTGLGAEPAAVSAEVLSIVQRVWDLVTAYTYQLNAEAYPERTAVSRAAAAARATALAELAEAHGAALTGVLAALRAPALDDAAARATATELAVEALAVLRRAPYWNRELSEEPADDAFHRAARELRPLFRHHTARLVLRAPGSTRSIPSDTAHTARAAVRAATLALLEQDGVGRVHVGWWLEDGELRAAVRDDGPGRLRAREAVTANVTELVAALGGTLHVDPVPDWGTTVTVTLPLVPALQQPQRPGEATPEGLNALHPRELHVLEQVALGRRNREIAGALGISESTVKFHVSNILAKLGATTRGEAAAMTRAWER
ncbi:LuxR C-terminal-related transcriptional regulator [Streptomyces sp. NPDC053499]|uniref:helix-turn-helix transcriptional regulator n=1 Tax=Streptomyces sp. NPDC053499 TaxID=3365707 RepID=UPI0037CCF203